MTFQIGCHVSIAGGIWNAPQNAADLGCETFQIFSRSPRGGPAAPIDEEAAAKFKDAMRKHGMDTFVIHCPYYINFGSTNPRIYHGSSAVIRQELERGTLLGASYVMTHLGSAKELGDKESFAQTKKGLVKVLEGYEGTAQFLLEIAAGAGMVIGDTFEELADIMEPLTKYKTFGGICFDTQHAFASGYDFRNLKTAAATLKKFDAAIGLKWLKMSHINDSKIELAGHKDRHEHIGEGLIGKEGLKSFLTALSVASNATSPPKGEKKNVLRAMPLILETEHDKVKLDIKILKGIRDGLTKK